ncbi:hypothetical protein CMV30_07380 [Nibricoccus aquaticus]|uniref:Uncharacterized protein n=1 Tax=Nibricoccus aquaticus TaxID=2576891 RepID=A0A290Q689_9BACT|nr:hypothetical protein [Nibricoccus aquaticus]ATC63787.1 hypothetical protein CMV30_07380 [Nibricoccus aquaticus]
MPAPSSASTATPATTPPREAPWAEGLRGARANLLPGLALQLFALALVLAYFWHAPTHHALERLSAWRSELGVTFAIVSTGLFGGLLPFLYLRLTAARYTWPQGALITAFWAYKGIEIDLWYRALAHLVGEGNATATVAAKMVLDQFLYCPLIAIPLTTLAYAYAETHFNTRAVLADLRAPRWYARRVLPLLISNIGVWVPAVCIIYALPTPLQLPLQNIVLCFFTLLLAHLAQQKTTDHH